MSLSRLLSLALLAFSLLGGQVLSFGLTDVWSANCAACSHLHGGCAPDCATDHDHGAPQPDDCPGGCEQEGACGVSCSGFSGTLAALHVSPDGTPIVSAVTREVPAHSEPASRHIPPAKKPPRHTLV